MRKYALAGIMHAITLAGCLLLMTIAGVFLRGDVDISGSVHWSPAEHVFDADLGWKGRPGFTAANHTHAPVPFPIDVQLNSDGFRDRDWNDLLRRNSSERILVVGDSFIYGWGSLGRDTFTTIAQELAHDTGRSLAFFNAGMSGYGFHHYRRAIQLYLSRIRPTQVWVMLTPNDIGDTALSYDHRYRQRVYRPFFDVHGKLNHASVPRRPSLWLADTVFGAWPGLLVLDELSYLLDDFGHYRSGLPTRYNSPLQIPLFDQLIWHRATLEKFPAIEQLVRRNIAGMIESSKSNGFALRFINNASDPEFDKYFDAADTYYDKGESLIREMWPWLTHLNEGHPNFVWAALLAGRGLGLDRQHAAIERSIAKRLVAELSFSSVLDAGRALSGFQWAIDGGRPYLKAGGHGFLTLLIEPSLRGRAKLLLTLETRNKLVPENIRVSLFNRLCSLLDTAGTPTTRSQFACDTQQLPLPFLAPFRIDVGTDAHFERASLAAPD